MSVAIAGATELKPNYITPPEVVEVARELLGGIDLDPATTEQTNTLFVQAPVWYAPPANGLVEPWHGRVFLNPPGASGGVKPWWKRLVDCYGDTVESAFFVSFSLDALQVLQRATPGGLLPFLTFIPDRRLNYWDLDAEGCPFETKQPPKPSAFTWLPDLSRACGAKIMRDTFHSVGIAGEVIECEL